jgi:hypothetical protein
MIISDLDYLDSIVETDAIDLNGGNAVANSTALAIATGSSTATSIIFKNLAISNPGGSLAASSVRSSAKSTGGNTFSAAFSSASASSSG